MNNTADLLPILKLRFNIEHPSIEESYLYGYDCANSGVEVEDNPFSAHTMEFEQWSEGWWAGFYNETPLFSLNESVNVPSNTTPIQAVNDHIFTESMGEFLIRVLEITSVIGVVAVVGYQVLELVA